MKIFKKFVFYLFVFFCASFLMWLGYLFFGGRDAAVLMYHSIGEALPKDDTLNVSAQVFDKQMKFLRDYRYHVISLTELVDLLEQKKRIPFKTVVITFDDGYENNYAVAYPILKKYRLPATIFLITDFIGRQEEMYGRRIRFMTPAMIREMSDSGLITFGSHTRSHLFLPKENDPAVLYREIWGSKEVLEKVLKKPVEAFCYPTGGYSAEIEKYVRRAGYRVAVTICPKRGFAHSDLYALKRIKITERGGNPVVFLTETSGYYLRMKEMNK